MPNKRFIAVPRGLAGSLQRYGLPIVPNFSLIALSAVVDPLRLANGVLGSRVDHNEFVDPGPGVVASSDSIRLLPDRTLADGHFDAIFGPNSIPRRGFGESSNWLHRQARRSAALGGVDTGAYLRGGLLDGYRYTIQLEDRETLVEHFPDLPVSNRLVELYRDRYICSDGVCPLDPMTLLLCRSPGSGELVTQVPTVSWRSSAARGALNRAGAPPACARACGAGRRPGNDEKQRRGAAHAGRDRPRLGLSRRTPERLFWQHLGVSPVRKYLELRLTRAHLVILRSNGALDEVAQATGLATPSHFIACYRADAQ